MGDVRRENIPLALEIDMEKARYAIAQTNYPFPVLDTNEVLRTLPSDRALESTIEWKD